MVVQSPKEAVDNAKSYTRCDPGMCLKYVRTWLEIPSRDSSAAVAWKNASGKHPDDRTPPRGAPLFWTGGSQGYGHITLNLEDNGNGSMWGTDMPSSGVCSSAAIAWVENHWGMRYEGWAESVNGVWIPYLKSGGGSKPPPDKPDWRSEGDVYVKYLHQGQQNSQSVSRLRWKLQHDNRIPDGRKPGLGDSSKDGANYTPEVTSAAKYWMQQVWQKSHGNGENFTNEQANALFGDNYRVIEE